MTDATQQPQPEFVIQRLYVKDSSFESPLAPGIFQENIQPTVNLNINTVANKLADHVFEVVLMATVTTKSNEKTVFLVEVKQAGIFTIKNVPEQNMNIILNVTCPTILFPYLREKISTEVTNGGFQHFYLAPINFEALYLSQQNRQAQPASGHAEQHHATANTHHAHADEKHDKKHKAKDKETSEGSGRKH